VPTPKPPPVPTPKPPPVPTPLPAAPVPVAALSPQPAVPVAPIKSQKNPSERPELPKPAGRKRSYGCLLIFLALGFLGVVTWMLSGLAGSLATAERCEAALSQARIALAAKRFNEAREAHDQAVLACPVDYGAQLESLSDEIEQAEATALCAGIEAEAAAFLGQARPRRAQRLLDEYAPRCGARTEYRNVAGQVETRIQRAERAMTEVRLALQRGELDVAEAALGRAVQIDAGVVGAKAMENALTQARQAALEPTVSEEMPTTELPQPEIVETPAVSGPPSMERVSPFVTTPSRPNPRSNVQRQIIDLLRAGENDLARRNYRGAITKAETAFLLDPGNRDARDLKRRAEAAENQALRDIEIH